VWVSALLPPGWTDENGFARPGQRVRDFQARGQLIQGRCDSEACRRWVRIDPRELSAIGLGEVVMTKLAAQWRCNRLQGCTLSLRGGPMTQALRMIHIQGRPTVRVRVSCTCQPCTFYRDVPTPEVMVVLKRRVDHDWSATPIEEVGKHWDETCPICDSIAWSSAARVLSEQSMSWKRIGEASWDLETWKGDPSQR
jgi:hypothetical protein